MKGLAEVIAAMHAVATSPGFAEGVDRHMAKSKPAISPSKQRVRNRDKAQKRARRIQRANR